MKIKAFLQSFIFIFVLFLVACSSEAPEPDISLAQNRSNDLIEGVSNCRALTQILRNEISKNLYIHGWESIGTKDLGYIIFYAGFEEIPKENFLVLAWKVNGDSVEYLANPSEAIDFLKVKMKDSRWDAGPASSMMKVKPDWDMCSFKNIDFYNGETFNFKEILKLSEKTKLWNKAIELPYYSLHQYLVESMKEKK